MIELTISSDVDGIVVINHEYGGSDYLMNGVFEGGLAGGFLLLSFTGKEYASRAYFDCADMGREIEHE